MNDSHGVGSTGSRAIVFASTRYTMFLSTSIPMSGVMRAIVEAEPRIPRLQLDDRRERGRVRPFVRFLDHGGENSRR